MEVHLLGAMHFPLRQGLRLHLLQVGGNPYLLSRDLPSQVLFRQGLCTSPLAQEVEVQLLSRDFLQVLFRQGLGAHLLAQEVTEVQLPTSCWRTASSVLRVSTRLLSTWDVRRLPRPSSWGHPALQATASQASGPQSSPPPHYQHARPQRPSQLAGPPPLRTSEGKKESSRGKGPVRKRRQGEQSPREGGGRRKGEAGGLARPCL